MSRKLVSVLGVAGWWLLVAPAVAADGQATGSMRLAQMPAYGNVQNNVLNPPPPRDTSDTPVKIMNFSRGVFRYQISRTSGKTWTRFYELPAGQMHLFSANKRSAVSIIRTMNGSGSPGYLFIRYPVPGGFEQFKVLGVGAGAVGGTENAYAYVVNSNGYGELVEPNLAGRPVPRIAAGAQELQLFQLYANHCYFDRVPNAPTPGRPFMPEEPNLPRSQ